MHFTKMQGIGNDYIYVNCFEEVVHDPSRLALVMSRPHFGVSADGLVLIEPSDNADFAMRIFNADGSEAQMCGNGIRCVAEWLHVHEPACAAKPVLKIDTRSGRKTLTRMGEELWQVEMGAYSTRAADLPAVNMGEGPLVRCPLTVDGKTWEVTCISVGNPHCVTLVPEVDGLKLEAIGPAFESHPNFPERINTEFVEFVDRTHLKMRVWERGSGETWACGTGTCATVAALVEQGLCSAGEDVHVALRGGELTIRVLPGRQLLMTGAASTVYEAVIEV